MWLSFPQKMPGKLGYIWPNIPCIVLKTSPRELNTYAMILTLYASTPNSPYVLVGSHNLGQSTDEAKLLLKEFLTIFFSGVGPLKEYFFKKIFWNLLMRKFFQRYFSLKFL